MFRQGVFGVVVRSGYGLDAGKGNCRNGLGMGRVGMHDGAGSCSE